MAGLPIEETNERIDHTESRMQPVRALMRNAEKMWALQPFTRSRKEAMEKEGQEQVVPNDPYTTTHLAMRLVSDKPLIEVPANQGNRESTGYKDIRQKWLRGAWEEINSVNGENVIRNGTWQAFVLSRACFQVTWILPLLPEKRKKTTFPIQVRNLSPYDTGVERGPYATEHAYHRYMTTLGEVAKRYPGAQRKKVFQKHKSGVRKGEDWRRVEVEFTDFWHEDYTGQIWNAKLLEDEYMQGMEKSDYPEIPIFEVYGDTSMSSDPALKSVSLLYPMEQLWKYKARLLSQMATGLLWYFWPFIYLMNEMGQVIPDTDVRPGQTAQWPAGSSLNVVQIQPNMNLAETMMNHIESSIQNAGFPNVMFGDAGDLQSGYGVNLLSQAAIGRTDQVRSNMEDAVVKMNEMMLGMVEKFADPDEGVTIYGYNVSTAKPFGETLLPKHMENGFHRNIVRLEPVMPEDDIQRITMAKTLADSNIISKRTVRDRFLRIPLPDDEENRILLEAALTSDELKHKTMINALVAYDPQNWEDFIAGTQLEELLDRIAAKEMAEEQMPALPGNGMPPAFPMNSSPNLPLPMGGPVPQPGPPIGPPGGGPTPTQPPLPMVPPRGGGIPPQIAGQLTPQMIGAPNMDPVMFAELMGRPLEPADRDLAMMGAPPRRY